MGESILPVQNDIQQSTENTTENIPPVSGVTYVRGESGTVYTNIRTTDTLMGETDRLVYE